MDFGQLLKIPLMYKYSLVFFTLVALSEIISTQSIGLAAHFFLMVLGACLLDIAATYLLQRKLILPYSAFITGAIIAIVVSPSNSPLGVIVLAAIASKHLLKWKGRPIFNPASFGIALGILLMPLDVTWHGAAFLPIVAVLGVALMYTSRKLEQGIAFWASLAILTTVGAAASGLDALNAFSTLSITGSTLFLAFFMATEPKTSPFTRTGQIAFAVAAATLVFASGYLLPDLFPFIGILAANALTPFLNGLTMPKH